MDTNTTATDAAAAAADNTSRELNLGFMKFSSIELSDNAKMVSKARELGLLGGVWVATEKIHGANFSLIVTADGAVQFAKRTALLSADEKFYGYQQLIEELTTKARSAFDRRRACQPDLRVLRIFGELFGGKYPHPDVPAVSGAVKVQEFVYYSPGLHFCAFDVHDGHRYDDWDAARDLLGAAGFMVARELCRGSFEMCFGRSEVFQTTIPHLFGLPPIANNGAEGLVIRPVATAYFPNGSRVIFKKKAEAFQEVTGCSKVAKTRAKQTPSDADRVRNDCISTLGRYITMQRLHGVVSKVGWVDEANKATLLKALAEDAIEDFVKENKSTFKRLSESDQNTVTKSAARPVFALVASYFKERSAEETNSSAAEAAAADQPSSK